ncbi:hypothetical protein [Streptomyces poonensis]|uniref:hypothetical protein n=1 Tax=Streptomyces poonensis TaxID=68255 RepID=UPI001673C9A5|nr:hypothetical protein [Streptomyces poonensis]
MNTGKVRGPCCASSWSIFFSAAARLTESLDLAEPALALRFGDPVGDRLSRISTNRALSARETIRAGHRTPR